MEPFPCMQLGAQFRQRERERQIMSLEETKGSKWHLDPPGQAWRLACVGTQLVPFWGLGRCQSPKLAFYSSLERKHQLTIDTHSTADFLCEVPVMALQ